jgi:hypothetical protein
MVQKVFGIPPNNSMTNQTILQPDEQSHSYNSIVLFGIEHDLLQLNILVYAITDWIFGNTFISLTVTFLMETLLITLRSHFGQTNLSNKSLVDDRFLL